MADFSYISDSDESAIDELISQTKDLCVLEQISAINCSGFSDSPLPSDLESRFRKLKSFPATKSRPPYSADCHSAFAPEPENMSLGKGKVEVPKNGEHDLPSVDEVHPKQSCPRSISFSANIQTKEANFSPLKVDSDRQKDLKVKVENGKIKHPEHGSDLDGLTPSSDSSLDEEIFAPRKQNSDRKRHLSSKSKSKPNSVSSPFGSSSTRTSSPSPPKKSGCFWCSPKKGSSLRKTKENQMKSRSFDWPSRHHDDDFLEDLGSFSMKEQQKILKRAMKEQERISREADKILQMAKQASARITSRFEDDSLSDNDE